MQKRKTENKWALNLYQFLIDSFTHCIIYIFDKHKGVLSWYLVLPNI